MGSLLNQILCILRDFVSIQKCFCRFMWKNDVFLRLKENSIHHYYYKLQEKF